MLPIALTLDRASQWGEVVTGVATAGLLLAAALAAWFGSRGVKAQIDAQRQIASQARTYEHLRAFYDLGFLEMTADISPLIVAFKQNRPTGEAMYGAMSPEAKAKVQAVFNFYEEVAGEYNARFLDEETAEPLIYVTAAMYEDASELVEWFRDQDPTYLEQWVRLHKNLKGSAGIPVSSPGWYQDPEDSTLEKWWDGFRWREYTRP
jgi:hypothetical protein